MNWVYFVPYKIISWTLLIAIDVEVKYNFVDSCFCLQLKQQNLENLLSKKKKKK